MNKDKKWRRSFLRELAADSQPETQTYYPNEDSATSTTSFICNNESIEVSIPNAMALFLDLSWQHHSTSEMLLQKCLVHKGPDGRIPDGDAFNFYQHIASSIVFAITSLEAFVNESIPEGFTYVVLEKKSTQSHSKEQIERYFNLDDKLGKILPLALNIPSPLKEKSWAKYIELRELRNRIIHLKMNDRRHKSPDNVFIWKSLMTDPLPETFTVARTLMKYFYDCVGNTPKWIQERHFNHF